MTRGPEVLTFSATAGCVMLVTSTALALIVWAAYTFVELVPALVDEAGRNRFLAREVIVERGCGDTERVRDVAYRGAIVATLDEQLERRTQDLLASTGAVARGALRCHGISLLDERTFSKYFVANLTSVQ